MKPTRSRAFRVAGLMLAGVTTAVALAGCGGSSGTPTAAPTNGVPGNGGPGNGGAGNSALAAYTTCLSQHGVTLPSRAAGARPSGAGRPSGAPGPSRSPGAGAGGFGGGGGRGSGGGFGFGDPANPPAGVDAATWSAALTACKSLQPTFNGRGGASGGPDNSAFAAYRNCLSDHGVTFTQGLSTADPKVAAALKTCAPLRPAGRPSTGSGPTVSPSPTG